MRKVLIVCAIVSFSAMLRGQSNHHKWSQESSVRTDKSGKFYTLSGFRNGSTSFPKVRFPQVQYEAGDSLKFDKYHCLDVIYTCLERWAERYPDLVDVYEVGKSFEERPILQITITNKKTGKDTDKPAAYIDGAHHAGEIIGTECVMWIAKYLIENYGKDPDVTHLLDTKSIYLRPVVGPDGHNLYLYTAQNTRSSVRPFDNDGDGLLDEDPPDDIDGDGIILLSRWKDEKKGNWILDPLDSTGRLMKGVRRGEGIYVLRAEGIDNDNDGKTDEDGPRGVDFNRNFPENWRPEKEETGRGYTQLGAGEYPLSESEVRSVFIFLLTHPNISVFVSLDSSLPIPTVLRPPSTSASDERMYPEDLKLYKTFDEIGKRITGYELAGDNYSDLTTNEGQKSGRPIFGHAPDFGYFYYGAINYDNELWNEGRNNDYNSDGKIDIYEMLRWDDEENEGNGFIEFKPFKHPVYGDVEIGGGYNFKFFLQNPPPKYLETWIRKEAFFDLELAKSLPELVWENIEVKKVKSYKADSADYQLKVSYINAGVLPTALKQAQLVKIVREDWIVLNFNKADSTEGKVSYKELADTKLSEKKAGGSSDGKRQDLSSPLAKNVPYTQGGAVTTTFFNIRIYNTNEVTGKASVFSTRGGVLRGKEFTFK